MGAERLFTLQRGAGSIPLARAPTVPTLPEEERAAIRAEGMRSMQKLVSEVMTAWRSADRLLAEMAPDDPARAAVIAAAEQLQSTFNELTMASGAIGAEPQGGSSGFEAAVRETSKDIAADARRLHAIETAKARTRSDDERLVALSIEAEELGDEIAAKTQAELNLAKEAAT